MGFRFSVGFFRMIENWEAKIHILTKYRGELIKQLHGRFKKLSFQTRLRVNICNFDHTPLFYSIPELNRWCCYAAAGTLYKTPCGSSGLIAQATKQQ